MSAPPRRLRLSLAARLYAAFAGAVLFTLTASLVAWNAFSDLREQQRVLSHQHLPAITTALRVAMQSKQITALAPSLLTVENETQRQEIMQELARLRQRYEDLSGHLDRVLQADAEDYNRLRLTSIATIESALFGLLDQLGRSVRVRLALRAALDRRLNQANDAHAQLRMLIVPIVDDQTFFLLTGYQRLDQDKPVPPGERLNVSNVRAFSALSDLAVESNLLVGLLREASIALDAPYLQSVQERITAAAARIDTALQALPDLQQTQQLQKAFHTIIELGSGEQSIPSLRLEILRQLHDSQKLLEGDLLLSEHLSTEVDAVVDNVQEHTRAAVAETERMTATRGMQLVWLNLGAIIGAAAIGWLYVRRSITTPIRKLTAAAVDFEHGRFEPASLAQTAALKDELGDLASTFTGMAIEVQNKTEHLDNLVAERTRQLDEKNAALRLSLQKIADELEMARGMQLSILPHAFPTGEDIAIHGHMHAAREIGGDFYDVIKLDEHKTGIAIADVSDKGVPAALVMAVAYTQLRSIAQRGLPPHAVIEEVNFSLAQENEDMLFVTAFYAVIDSAAGTMTYVNAGHEPPFLVHADRSAEKLPLTGGVALGVKTGLCYREHSVALRPGDVLFCYTDGITEAFNSSGEAFSSERLKDALTAGYDPSVSAICEAVLQAIGKHVADAQQSDDIACLAVMHLPVQSGAADERVLRVSIAPQLAEIRPLAEKVEAFGQQWNLPVKTVQQINLCLDELLTNIVQYGVCAPAEALIEIRLRVREGSLTINIEDNGAPFNPLDTPEVDVEQSLDERRVGGLGIHIVRNVMDGMEYERRDNKNLLRLHKSFNEREVS